MNTNTMPLEPDTRVLIDRSLENLGWKLNGKEKNVFFEQPRTEAERKKLGGKRPDYVLYSKESERPLIVIEAKKKGSRIDVALEQGINYARAIDAPLVFATDGVFCKAFHTVANRTPILNGEEMDEFIRESLALRYLTSYEVNTVSQKVQYDRKELIRIFDEANNMLRGEGLRAGIERFGEFANILFLKLISESELIKKESGIKTKFDIACSWDIIKQIPASTRIEYINNTVYDKLNTLYNTDIFTKLQITDSSILKEIMDKLDPLMLTDVDSDVKGDAFEYFLKASTSTKNDLGEYFTPRHIVKTMVRLVNPQIGEKIYDPFCGTGGFLIESFRYIYNNMARTEANMKLLREQTVYGNEITNTARITKMNMILAGDGHSNIIKQDSLSNPIDGSALYTDENGQIHHCGFDIVLANIPYSQKTKHGNLYDLPSTNGDSICVQHCMKAINSASENSRMALVVPEGFLFRKDLTKTREYLLENCQLQSIISLPQGVFLPYTGVKTDIIYATRVNQKIKTTERHSDFWYFDVKSDGYTLDNHRRKLDASSDLSKYEEYRKLDKDQIENMLKVGFEIIPFSKVRQNSNILVGSRYRTFETISKFEIVKFSDIATLIRGVNYQKSQQSISRTSNVILTADNITLLGELRIQKEIFVDDTVKLIEEKRLKKNDIFICMSSGSKEHIGKVAYIDQDTNYYAGGFMGIIRTNPQRCLSKFLYFYLLTSEKYRDEIKLLTQGANINNISSTINSIKIPLPPIELQQKIVAELDGYQKIISGAQAIVSNYRPTIAINAAWKATTMGELFEVVSDTINPTNEMGTVFYIGLENIESNTGKIIGQVECDINTIKSTKRIFKDTDILFGKLRPTLNKVAFPNRNGICSTDIIVLRAKDKNILPEFYSILLRDSNFNKQVLNGVSGGQLPRVDINYFLNLPIYEVPLTEQSDIMDKIKTEKQLTKSTEQLIAIFSAKIESKIKEVWE
ncbi:MAG: N-6 DNA methylase [Blautia sp.]|nr:N-6 DNA methylase [Blautia sp.]